jgi:hypothetical protein
MTLSLSGSISPKTYASADEDERWGGPVERRGSSHLRLGNSFSGRSRHGRERLGRTPPGDEKDPADNRLTCQRCVCSLPFSARQRHSGEAARRQKAKTMIDPKAPAESKAGYEQLIAKEYGAVKAMADPDDEEAQAYLARLDAVLAANEPK